MLGPHNVHTAANSCCCSCCCCCCKSRETTCGGQEAAESESGLGWLDGAEQRERERESEGPVRLQLFLQTLVVLDLRGNGDGRGSVPDGPGEHDRFAAGPEGSGAILDQGPSHGLVVAPPKVQTYLTGLEGERSSGVD